MWCCTKLARLLLFLLFVTAESSTPFSEDEIQAVVPMPQQLAVLPEQSTQRCYVVASGMDEPVQCRFALFGSAVPHRNVLELPLHFHRLNNRMRLGPKSDTIYNGHTILAHRGRCSWYDKAVNAQEGGGAALILINDADADVRVGSFGNETTLVTIPVVVVHSSDGAAIKRSWRTAVDKGEAPQIHIMNVMDDAADSEYYGQQLREAVGAQPTNYMVRK